VQEEEEGVGGGGEVAAAAAAVVVIVVVYLCALHGEIWVDEVIVNPNSRRMQMIDDLDGPAVSIQEENP
jgi:hypothetical protein